MKLTLLLSILAVLTSDSDESPKITEDGSNPRRQVHLLLFLVKFILVFEQIHNFYRKSHQSEIDVYAGKGLAEV